MTAVTPPAGARWRRLWIAAAIAALTLLSFCRFPGHTYLQSDTQIYLPILERYWDSSVLSRDLVATHPHVSFTVYDEAALTLRRISGLDFRAVLAGEQFLFRGLGILGVFLLAAALGLSSRMALLVAAVFSLGAAIGGPTVLSVEYEPVPRGFAVPLLLLAAGLAAHGRDLGAGIAASIAFLYHPTTVLPFWIVYFGLALMPSQPGVMRRRILGLLPILGGVAVLLVLSRMQPGIVDPWQFFGRIDPELERLQRMRAPYVWVSMWTSNWVPHYLLLWAVSLTAFWRVRRAAGFDARFFLLGLPLIGMASLPASWLLLEKWKWIAAPQIQPARAVLFVTVIAGILAAVAAVKAGEQRRYWETALWFGVAFLIPAELPLAIILALAATVAIWVATSVPRVATAAVAAAAILPFVVLPTAAKPDTAAVEGLSAWARQATPKDAVFLFPDAGREPYPGVFRAMALRAVYTDWKSGGQVNFLGSFAREWWARWERTGKGRFHARQVPAYRSWGIDYFVLKSSHRLPGRTPVFENTGFVAYRP